MSFFKNDPAKNLRKFLVQKIRDRTTMKAFIDGDLLEFDCYDGKSLTDDDDVYNIILQDDNTIMMTMKDADAEFGIRILFLSEVTEDIQDRFTAYDCLFRCQAMSIEARIVNFYRIFS